MSKKQEVVVSEEVIVIAPINGVEASELSGMDKNQAFRFMMIEKNLEQDACNKVWAAFGVKNKGGVFNNFLEFCIEKPQTASDLAEFLMSDKSSSNEVRWFNQRDQIRKTANKVATNLGVEFTEVEVTEEQSKKMAALVKIVDDSNKAKKAAAVLKAAAEKAAK